MACPFERFSGVAEWLLGLTKPEVPNALRILFLWFHPY
jgi:hypothetical protein